MFELHNPRKRAVECILRGSFGTILIPGESFVPTPEQEKKGLRADMLADFIPKFLKPTPPVVRRRLLEASKVEVPADLIDATSHLVEFGGVDPTEISAAVEESEVSAPRGEGKTSIPIVHEHVPVLDEDQPTRPDLEEAPEGPLLGTEDEEVPEAVEETQVAPVAKETYSSVKETTLASEKAQKEAMQGLRTPEEDMTTLPPGTTRGALTEWSNEVEKKMSRGKILPDQASKRRNRNK